MNALKGGLRMHHARAKADERMIGVVAQSGYPVRLRPDYGDGKRDSRNEDGFHSVLSLLFF